MNERQARAQHRLSTGGHLGRDSSSDFDSEDYPEVSSAGEGEKEITMTTFIIMLIVGLCLDILGLVPLIGWGLSSIILILIYLALGVKFHLKNVLKFGGCDLAKFVPFVSIIPTFMLAVILNLGPMVAGLSDKIPGGAAVANKVQKAMSMTKK
jgi:hypothetical protein